jgi:hypothetical protein
MLNVMQLSSQVVALAANRLGFDEFEEWFRSESRNVHLWGDERLNRAVFSIEAIFSEYHFADLDEDSAIQEMVNSVRPFERAHLEKYVAPSPAPMSKPQDISFSFLQPDRDLGWYAQIPLVHG